VGCELCLTTCDARCRSYHHLDAHKGFCVRENEAGQLRVRKAVSRGGVCDLYCVGVQLPLEGLCDAL